MFARPPAARELDCDAGPPRDFVGNRHALRHEQLALITNLYRWSMSSRPLTLRAGTTLERAAFMLSELAVRFLLGGAVVSAFSVVAEMWEPKTFAGIFGAAPSVALASLALAFHKHGGAYVAIEGRSMVIG